jgi:transposase
VFEWGRRWRRPLSIPYDVAIVLYTVSLGDPAPKVAKLKQWQAHSPCLRCRQILPRFAIRNTKYASGLGRLRWVVECTFAWLNQFRRLRVRNEKRPDLHLAFLTLACILICWKFLQA